MLSQYTRQAVTQRLLDGEVREKLQEMLNDPALNTCISSYSANAELYPSGQIPFIEKHIAYLMDHPRVDYEQYLSNLRLMLKVRA
ncbi:MAG TPA: hypothetical protein VLG13_01905 [Patescibacteria group bacterium]|nr:hypothetical protein [Patescibacteria group bacterium]